MVHDQLLSMDIAYYKRLNITNGTLLFLLHGHKLLQEFAYYHWSMINYFPWTLHITEQFIIIWIQISTMGQTMIKNYY